jgi:hypothetical protein
LVEDDHALERVSSGQSDALTEHHLISDLWIAAPEPAVSVRRWNDDTVVYVVESAATHWLEKSAAAVFLALQSAKRALTTHEIAATAAACIDDEGIDLEALLLQLHSLGLVFIERPALR